MNQEAMALWASGLNPLLLQRNRRRPVVRKWRVALVLAEEVARWPAGRSVGIRCGRQRMGLCLMALAFTADAGRIFPEWLRQAEEIMAQPLLVARNRQGYQVYFFTGPAYSGRIWAGRYDRVNGRARVTPLIKAYGRGQWVTAVGSKPPGGMRYRFAAGKGYDDIPLLTIAEYERLMALSRAYDQRALGMRGASGMRRASVRGGRPRLAWLGRGGGGRWLSAR